MKAALPFFALALVLTAGCGTPTTPAATPAPTGVSAITAEDKAAIESLSNSFGEAMKAGDWDTLAAAYAEDAIMYPPDAPAVNGREAIKKSFSEFPPVKDFVAEIHEIDGYGDLAFLRGSAVLTMTTPDGKEAKAAGKYIEIYRKQSDGKWLMVRDIYNMDAPSGG
ncbi:MAG: SgcJ/EcaC family oxidoreductase [Fimbriimonadaceae bacterium]|nr:SgcJ/EcaC family oxidoreductase [Chthonomonadaceae bacterium]MCO5298069.1 SgcJ/EcaC family oxidoreductase [Fimbriimonadaceae bacterium]